MRKKRPKIKDELTELEYTYDRLNLDDDNLMTGAANHDYNIRHDVSNETESDVKRLSISNVRKFEEMLQRRVGDPDNPGLDYAKHWLNDDVIKAKRDAEQKFEANRKRPVATSPEHTRQGESLRYAADVRRAEHSLPRKITDDMAFRKAHPIPPSAKRNQSSPGGSNVSLSSKSTSALTTKESTTWRGTGAGSLRSDAQPAHMAQRRYHDVPDPVYDDVVNRSLRRSRSPEKKSQSNASNLPSATSVDYMNDRSHVEASRSQLRMKPRVEYDKYHDDMAYRKLRRDASPVKVAIPASYYEQKTQLPSLKVRSRSLDRSKARQLNQSAPLRRSNSFERKTSKDLPKVPKALDTGVAKMVDRFLGASKELSQSAPNLNDQNVFGNNYNAFGELVSTDPKFKYAQKPRKKETPRIVKQRSEFRAKNKSKSGDSGFCAESGESDVSHSSGTETLSQQPTDGTTDHAYESDDVDVTLTSAADATNRSSGDGGIHNRINRFEEAVVSSPRSARSASSHASASSLKVRTPRKDTKQLRADFFSSSESHDKETNSLSPKPQRPTSIDLTKRRLPENTHIISIHRSPQSSPRDSRNIAQDDIKPKAQFQLKRDMLRPTGQANSEPTNQNQAKYDVKLSKPKQFQTSAPPAATTTTAAAMADRSPNKAGSKEMLARAFTAPKPKSEMQDFDARLESAKWKLTHELSPRVSKVKGRERPKSVDMLAYESEQKRQGHAGLDIRILRETTEQNKAEAAPPEKSVYHWSPTEKQFKKTVEEKHDATLKTQKQVRSEKSVHITSGDGDSALTSEVSQHKTAADSPAAVQDTHRKVNIIRVSASGQDSGGATKQRTVAKVEPQSASSHAHDHAHARQRSYDFSDGELTDATDVTIDSLVCANIRGTATFSPIHVAARDHSEVFSPLNVRPVKRPVDFATDGTNKNTDKFEHAHSSSFSASFGGKTVQSVSTTEETSTKTTSLHKTEMKTTETVDISGVVLRKKESSEYKRDVKKEIKEERRLSLKDRVKIFEDQAYPFLKGPRVNDD